MRPINVGNEDLGIPLRGREVPLKSRAVRNLSIDDSAHIRRVTWERANRGAVRVLLQVRSVDLHAEDVIPFGSLRVLCGARRTEDNALAIRRPVWMGVICRIVGQPSLIRTVRIHDINLSVAIALLSRCERNQPAIGRPGGCHVAASVMRELHQAGTIRIY